ncbi:MAG TPA: C39 family peptidase, partial [Anaerolineales bacterium]|nr:C39 family peptidase [Anaerolineales bacterium]
LGAMTPNAPSGTPATPETTPTSAGPTASLTPTPAPTITPTPIPTQVRLTGIIHEYQKFNNCGPANLSMALSYWGWKGDQRDTRSYLRPLESDKNVNPAEMLAFVEQATDLKAVVRVGGDLETLKRFIAAGFPVIVEKGYDQAGDAWLGHYLTFSGYDDSARVFISQDSLIAPDLPVDYDYLRARWRDFNFVYLVIFPPEREAQVLSLLGPQADPLYNLQFAAQLAEQEAAALTGREQYFAWFNLGSSRVALGDFAGAAQAYDQAFAIYPTIPEDQRPWRVMWYQDGPYAAYYYTERYQDVIELANTTFFALGEYTLEEAFYWRGLAKEALADWNGAVFDLRKAIELNANFNAAREQLERLEAEAP